jgi:hypothetical protein
MRPLPGHGKSADVENAPDAVRLEEPEEVLEALFEWPTAKIPSNRAAGWPPGSVFKTWFTGEPPREPLSPEGRGQGEGF